MATLKRSTRKLMQGFRRMEITDRIAGYPSRDERAGLLRDDRRIGGSVRTRNYIKLKTYERFIPQ